MCFVKGEKPVGKVEEELIEEDEDKEVEPVDPYIEGWMTTEGECGPSATIDVPKLLDREIVSYRKTPYSGVKPYAGTG